MMTAINLLLLSLSIMVLIGFLLLTRKHDNCGWWIVRILLTHSLICVVYLLHFINNHPSSDEFLLLQMGILTQPLGFCLAFYLAYRHKKHLLNQQNIKRNFSKELQQLFNKYQ